MLSKASSASFAQCDVFKANWRAIEIKEGPIFLGGIMHLHRKKGVPFFSLRNGILEICQVIKLHREY